MAINLRSGPTMTVPTQPEPSNFASNSGKLAITLTEFLYFPLLSGEIREQIWEHAIENDTKIFEMKHRDFYLFEGENPVSQEAAKKADELYKNNKNDHRGLLGACYESRSIILPTLTIMRLGYGQQILFNPERDTIYFGPSSYVPNWTEHEVIKLRLHSYMDLSRISYDFYRGPCRIGRTNRGVNSGLHPLLSHFSFGGEQRKIRNLAIDQPFFSRSKRMGTVLSMLNEFPNLEKLSLCAGDMGERMLTYDTGEIKKIVPANRNSWEVRNEKPTLISVPLEQQMCLGNLEFVDGAVQFCLDGLTDSCRLMFQKDILILENLEVSTVCVKRGGRFYGHENHFEKVEE